MYEDLNVDRSKSATENVIKIYYCLRIVKKHARSKFNATHDNIAQREWRIFSWILKQKPKKQSGYIVVVNE